MVKNTLKIGSRQLTITNPRRVLFPDDNITKQEFVEYHLHIAGIMVPHLKGRPTVMYRIFEDIRREGHYQQAIPESAPEWVHRKTVKKEGGTVTHLICDNAATLVYIANQDCITLHVWLSRQDKLDYPDQMIFDLDPPGENFEIARDGAFHLKKLLDAIGLASFLKTTGSHGLHIVVPLSRTENFETVRIFAQKIANLMVCQDLDRFTTEQRKEKRQGRLFIDTLRNAYGHTAVAPYAVRAYPGAPVSSPLAWDELKNPDLNSRSYNIRNIFIRLKQNGDPWKDLDQHTHTLSEHRSKLEEIIRG